MSFLIQDVNYLVSNILARQWLPGERMPRASKRQTPYTACPQACEADHFLQEEQEERNLLFLSEDLFIQLVLYHPYLSPPVGLRSRMLLRIFPDSLLGILLRFGFGLLPMSKSAQEKEWKTSLWQSFWNRILSLSIEPISARLINDDCGLSLIQCYGKTWASKATALCWSPLPQCEVWWMISPLRCNSPEGQSLWVLPGARKKKTMFSVRFFYRHITRIFIVLASFLASLHLRLRNFELSVAY